MLTIFLQIFLKWVKFNWKGTAAANALSKAINFVFVSTRILAFQVNLLFQLFASALFPLALICFGSIQIKRIDRLPMRKLWRICEMHRNYNANCDPLNYSAPNCDKMCLCDGDCQFWTTILPFSWFSICLYCSFGVFVNTYHRYQSIELEEEEHLKSIKINHSVTSVASNLNIKYKPLYYICIYR